MIGNRKAAEAEALKWIGMLLPGSSNVDIYKQRFAAMSDEAFEAYIQQLDSDEEILSLIAPNLDDLNLTIENNLAVAEKLGHTFFERCWLTDPKTGVEYLTPIKYLIVDLSLRRQQQLLQKKISIPDNNRHVDELTGQPTGDSQGSKLSFPETQVLYAQGLDRALEELLKFRGGDTKAFQAMNRSIIDTGGVSLDAIKRVRTKVKSTETLSTFLSSMHLSNNVAD
jgi:hypothetical protein